MLDHVSITVSDIAATEHFYDAIMKALGNRIEAVCHHPV